MGLRVVDHVLDFVFGEAAVGGDGDLLLLAGAEILRGDVQDAVRVDIKRDFDLRDAAGRRGDRIQMELADGLVVLRHRAFALQHVDFNARLVVGRRGEDFALLVRNRRVAFDQLREDTAQGFDTQRQRRDIQQDDVVDIALQDAALDSRADGDDFVRVHAFVRRLAEDFFSDLLGARHTGHTADQDHFVDFGRVQIGVAQAVTARRDRALRQIFRQLLQRGAGERLVQVHRASRAGRDEREVDFRAVGRRKFAFRLFGGFLQPLQGHLVLAEINAVFLLEIVDQPADDGFIEVIAAQMGIAVRRLHFEDAVAEFQDGDIERTAAQVVDGDLFVFLLVHAVGQ